MRHLSRKEVKNIFSLCAGVVVLLLVAVILSNGAKPGSILSFRIPPGSQTASILSCWAGGCGDSWLDYFYASPTTIAPWQMSTLYLHAVADAGQCALSDASNQYLFYNYQFLGPVGTLTATTYSLGQTALQVYQSGTQYCVDYNYNGTGGTLCTPTPEERYCLFVYDPYENYSDFDPTDGHNYYNFPAGVLSGSGCYNASTGFGINTYYAVTTAPLAQTTVYKASCDLYSNGGFFGGSTHVKSITYTTVTVDPCITPIATSTSKSNPYAYELPNNATPYRINWTDGAQSYNFCIKNTGANNYFIPAKTYDEIRSFVDKIPYLSGVTTF